MPLPPKEPPRLLRSSVSAPNFGPAVPNPLDIPLADPFVPVPGFPGASPEDVLMQQLQEELREGASGLREPDIFIPDEILKNQEDLIRNMKRQADDLPPGGDPSLDDLWTEEEDRLTAERKEFDKRREFMDRVGFVPPSERPLGEIPVTERAGSVSDPALMNFLSSEPFGLDPVAFDEAEMGQLPQPYSRQDISSKLTRFHPMMQQRYLRQQVEDMRRQWDLEDRESGGGRTEQARKLNCQ